MGLHLEGWVGGYEDLWASRGRAGGLDGVEGSELGRGFVGWMWEARAHDGRSALVQGPALRQVTMPPPRNGAGALPAATCGQGPKGGGETRAGLGLGPGLWHANRASEQDCRAPPMCTSTASIGGPWASVPCCCCWVGPSATAGWHLHEAAALRPTVRLPRRPPQGSRCPPLQQPRRRVQLQRPRNFLAAAALCTCVCGRSV